MIKPSLTRLAVVLGGLGLSLTAATGIASATPDLGPAVETTCTYPQLMSALNAADPTAAAVVNNSPAIKAGLNQFLAAPPAQRQRMAESIANDPANQPYLGLYQTVFSTCNNF
ncbi:hemophore-related protein [Mycolicibacterium celeriflavum]|nr:hemophore-related protein [Mycolicibacterium celeriflavum]MCV7241152.1 hemophore-related protein [Mycolicibacterium celeriflavum]ORA45053.1 hemophore-related protein [Mycolicibacterium celeriflavum]